VVGEEEEAPPPPKPPPGVEEKERPKGCPLEEHQKEETPHPQGEGQGREAGVGHLQKHGPIMAVD
jgi:hypothetical protein